eukprot:364358-Chlamydomonas_euryale.AAC.8
MHKLLCKPKAAQSACVSGSCAAPLIGTLRPPPLCPPFFPASTAQTAPSLRAPPKQHPPCQHRPSSTLPASTAQVASCLPAPPKS